MTARPSVTAFLLAVASLSGEGTLAQTTQRTTPPASFPDGHDTPLGQQVHQLLHDPAVARAHWGIAVTTLQGVPVYGLDQDKLFRPASTAKLFTMAAALTLFGPEFRFHTRAYGDLDATTGLVRGDLTIRGGGDPSFGTDDLPYHRETAGSPAPAEANSADSLQTFAGSLIKAGVRQISGQLVGDDTLFEAAKIPEGWAAEDLLWGYGTLPNALAVNNNELTITVTASPSRMAPDPGLAPLPAIASVDQIYPYLHVVDQVTTLLPGSTQASALDARTLSDSQPEIRLFGAISAGGTPVKEHVALPDPALYAAGALRALLIERGASVAGGAAALHSPEQDMPQSFLAGLRAPGCETNSWAQGASACGSPCPDASTSSPLLVDHVSRPLMEEVAYTLKTSANVHAEMLLHQLGLRVSCSGSTTLQGARVLRAWLLRAGLQDGDFVLYDGSGLSTKDLVTPRAETDILAYAAGQPWFPQWLAALPLGGVDGTLASRFTDPSLKGRVFAKTGTLGETRALAGYIQCVSGAKVIFSILVDDHEPGQAADRTVMDRIVAAIANSQ